MLLVSCLTQQKGLSSAGRLTPGKPDGITQPTQPGVAAHSAQHAAWFSSEPTFMAAPTIGSKQGLPAALQSHGPEHPTTATSL
jgi:hypothetical protein